MRQGTLKVRYRKIRFASERRVVLFYRLGIPPNFSSRLDTYSSPYFYRLTGLSLYWTSKLPLIKDIGSPTETTRMNKGRSAACTQSVVIGQPRSGEAGVSNYLPADEEAVHAESDHASTNIG
ncbi:hypothetical protein CUMW_272280 [Citrus unshiu]|uniref:Uncharacterized protein n=2 Tax=Citrus TaxID=2706 RepID=A0A067D2N9_CITSI|nr:hypothetical protein CISIN_1g039465mg [Citrus sinensis]GAY31809.1 hypothetical protein CUMW_272280 [Citrus unshiu]